MSGGRRVGRLPRVESHVEPVPVAVSDEPTPVAAQFNMPEELVAGVYANFAVVWHTAHEFTLDFFAPAGPERTDTNGEPTMPFMGVARVRVPVSVVFEIARAISTNVSRWEQATGQRLPSGEAPTYPPDEGDR